jgi:hypothetical protein
MHLCEQFGSLLLNLVTFKDMKELTKERNMNISNVENFFF